MPGSQSRRHGSFRSSGQPGLRWEPRVGQSWPHLHTDQPQEVRPLAIPRAAGIADGRSATSHRRNTRRACLSSTDRQRPLQPRSTPSPERTFLPCTGISQKEQFAHPVAPVVSNRLRLIGDQSRDPHLQIPFPLCVIEINQVLVARPNRPQADASGSVELKLPTADAPPHQQRVFLSDKLVFQQALLGAQLCMHILPQVVERREGRGGVQHRSCRGRFRVCISSGVTRRSQLGYRRNRQPNFPATDDRRPTHTAAENGIHGEFLKRATCGDVACRGSS